MDQGVLHVERVRGLIDRAAADPGAAPGIARRLVEAMALAQQGAVLLAHAPAPVAEAFCLARLGDDRSAEYGALPDGVDIDALVARA